jgi:cytochrome c oxidase subunit 2
MPVRHVTFVLVALLLAPARGAGPVPQAGPRVIEISAERFEFWPSEIRLRQGEQVEFRIASADTVHGFRLVGTGTNVLVPKRGKGYAVARFTAAQPGRYTFECSRLCGAGHNFMRGEVVVTAAGEAP